MNVLDQCITDRFSIYHADCAEALRAIPDSSVHYSIFSPPFSSLYTYSASTRDMGNCRTHDEFHEHFAFLMPEILRVLKPGRLLSMHCMLLPTSKVRDGEIGLVDFRGMLIASARRAGFIFHSEVCIFKNPVTAMQRTKARGLLHKELMKDSCHSRQGIADYLVTMLKPGLNAEPVTHTSTGDPFYVRPGSSLEEKRPSINMWQRYASPVWATATGIDSEGFTDFADSDDGTDDGGIPPGDTLTAREARDDDDERHLCALQLPVIRRAVRLWTNEGDVVLSPFAGIGSEGFASLLLKRRYIGIELKRSYYEQAVKNLRRAESEAGRPDLFQTFAGGAGSPRETERNGQ